MFFQVRRVVKEFVRITFNKLCFIETTMKKSISRRNLVIRSVCDGPPLQEGYFSGTGV